MDEQAFKELVDRLGEANQVVADLDPAIRAEAFELMRPYVEGGDAVQKRGGRTTRSRSAAKPAAKPAAKTPTPKPARKRSGPPPAKDAVVVESATEAEEKLVESHLSDTEADNAMLALAIFYGRHGRAAFDMAHLQAIARQFNLNVPSRMDKTFRAAKRGADKKLVTRKQEDGWKVQPGGGNWLKETYGVEMGRQPLPTAAEG
ncbi:MAG: hypothetical protein QOI89_2718 [Solirubrobacteraceae bacterium]|jgi:hypothetical protein|nr:hypothetical protein [Solirubrobacteraceae bacterium]